MRLIYGADEAVARWTALHVDDCDRGFGPCKAVGVFSGDKIVAGVVFHNWSPETQVIEVSCAAISPHWAARSILTELFDYPFSFCRLVVTRFSEKNKRVEKLWRAFGADLIRLPDMRAEGEAEILATLKPAQWKKSRLYNG